MKTRVIILLLFFGFVHSFQAQEKKIRYGLSLFPNYSYGKITNDGTVSTKIENSYKKNEVWKFSYSASVFVECFFSDNTSLNYGLGYQNNGVTTKKEPVITQDIYANPPLYVKRSTNHHNIEIPVHFKYYITKRIYGLIGAVGIINISNRSTEKLFYPDDAIEKTTITDTSTEFRKINMSASIGAGLDFKKEKCTLFFQPMAQYALKGVSETASLNRNMLSIGLVCGIRI